MQIIGIISSLLIKRACSDSFISAATSSGKATVFKGTLVMFDLLYNVQWTWSNKKNVKREKRETCMASCRGKAEKGGKGGERGERERKKYKKEFAAGGGGVVVSVSGTPKSDRSRLSVC